MSSPNGNYSMNNQRQGCGCGCGKPMPCTLSAPAPPRAPCGPAPFHASECQGSEYFTIRQAYGRF